MSRYGKWPRYVPVAERRAKAMRQVEKLRKKGQSVDPVVIDGRTIASTFWGKAWCENLESYHDFENRLPRGRTYVRNGSVLDLQIKAKEIQAMVSGSSIYKVNIRVAALQKPVWKNICQDCAGGIDSLVELLQGRLNKGVMDRLCRQENGLFPKPSQIYFSCSCPDYAYMCKHVAAVLYGVGSRLDQKPELLFLLRAVDQNDLVVNIDPALPLAGQGPQTEKRLESDDISQLFGLDMADVAEKDSGTGQAKKSGQAAKTTGNTSTPRAEPKGGRSSSSSRSPESLPSQDDKKPAKTQRPPSAGAEKQENPAWLAVEDLIARRNESGYKRATARLTKMRDRAQGSQKTKAFSRRLTALRARHQRKRRFIEQLDAAGLK